MTSGSSAQLSDTGHKQCRSVRMHQFDISNPAKRAPRTLTLDIYTSRYSPARPAQDPSKSDPTVCSPCVRSAAGDMADHTCRYRSADLAICSRGSNASDPSKAHVSVSTTWWLGCMGQESSMNCIEFLGSRRSRIRPKHMLTCGVGQCYGNSFCYSANLRFLCAS